MDALADEGGCAGEVGRRAFTHLLGHPRDLGAAVDVDLTAAVEHLQREGAESGVIMGASMGGTATINVASKLDLAGAA